MTATTKCERRSPTCTRGASTATTVHLLRAAIHDDANLTRPASSYEASRLRVTPRTVACGLQFAWAIGPLRNLMEFRIHGGRFR